MTEQGSFEGSGRREATLPEDKFGGNDYRPLESFMFGQSLPWGHELTQVYLYVELPFWLMMDPATIAVEYEGTQFALDICGSQVEIFFDQFSDSRRTLAWRGPQQTSNQWTPPPELEALAAETGLGFMSRPCKTVLRLKSQGLAEAFDLPDDGALPRESGERDAYWASLCEAHLPIVNELIQRYRLTTYDYFAYEVSPWDVPVWYVRSGETSRAVVIMPYKAWDHRPVTIGQPPDGGGESPVRAMQFTDAAKLSVTSTAAAIPGEFELLDARSLMERGDYTGAVRRATTAIEAIVEWRLRKELRKSYAEDEVEKRLIASQNDFPGRFRQLQKLLGTQTLSDSLSTEFEATRRIRHEIVHRGRRLTHQERDRAQRSVDTGRWLFNTIEAIPERARLRDFGVMKSVGRAALALRLPTRITSVGVEVYPRAVTDEVTGQVPTW